MNSAETRQATRFLWAFALLFVALGLAYSTLTPLFENSDETLHYPYIKNLADGRGLPLALPGQLWHQEGTQPPLYYAIVAASTFWLNTANLPNLLQPNPHWLYTEVRRLINDNQNLVLHGPMDAFPYHRAALAAHIGRWWSLAFGLLTVVGAFLLARRLCPGNLPLAITATALTALNPQFIRVSATVSNDSLSAALTTLAVLLALKFTTPGAPTSQPVSQPVYRSIIPPLLLGLLSGLALLTKLSSLTTLLLLVYIVYWRLLVVSEIHQSPLKIATRWLVIIVAVTVALTGWWFWRNYQLYGEWLATETHLNLAGRADISLLAAWDMRHEAERAYWATFGWGQIRPPEWVYQLFFWFTRLGLAGLGLALLTKLIQGPKSRPLPLNLSDLRFDQILFLLFWVGLNLALYLRWVLEVGSVSHTRLVFPAIAAISLLLALGWHALLPRRLAPWFSGLVTALLLTLNLYSLGWLIYPAFRPASSSALSSSSSLNLTFLDRMTLTTGQISTQNDPSAAKPQAKSGDTVLVSAGWQVLAPPDKNYSVSIVLLAPDGRVLAHRETYPGLGLRPTRYLAPGDTFVDIYPLQLTAAVTTPLVARAAVSLFDVDSASRAGLPARDAQSNEVTPVVGQLKITPQPWPTYQPRHAVEVNFDKAITLTGYDLDEAGLTLYWQAQALIEADYVVFIHLLDTAGQVIAQADAPPTNGAYPTRWWSPGETIADPHPLPAVKAAAIRLGLYRLDTGQRLPITASTLPTQDNSAQIEVK